MSNYNVNLTDITDTRQVNVNVTTGDKGWSAELVMVRRESDGALVALREWIGGSGEKPTPSQYVTENGFTDDIEEAVPFDIAPQTLYQSEVGKIGITEGNEIDLNTVNLEGDQTIDGDKTWTGEQTLTTLSGVGDRVVVADELGKLSANAALDDFEMVANKATDFDTLDDTLYPTTKAAADYVDNFVGDGELSVTTADGLSGSVSFSANQSGDAQLEIGVDEGYVLPTSEEWDNKADLVDGKVPSTQLPSYVDDVLEFPDFASLPAVGESGKIYVTLDDNKIYRWSGSTYVQVSESLALGETSSTAYRGDRGKIAYDYSQVGHLPLAGGTVTGQIKRDGDAVAGEDVPRLSQVVPYTGATSAVDLGTQNLTIGGNFTKNISTLDQKILFGTTGIDYFRVLRDVASLSRVQDTSTQGDIVVTLPIRTSTRWMAKIDIITPDSTHPTSIYVWGYNTSNTFRGVYAIGNTGLITEVKFGRIEGDTVLIIKRSGSQVFSYGKVNLAEFYHYVTYDAALVDKSNYKIEFIKESDLVGFTLNGTITNAQFIRDPYYLDYDNLTNKPDFSGYVPYTGASSAVNLNAQNLTNVGTFRAGVTQIPTNTVEVTEKNRSYYLITHTDGAPVAKWETQRWTGAAFAAANSFGFGLYALQNNTGAQSNGFGTLSMQNNTGGNSNGFGHQALGGNTGASSNGFGHTALQNNTGLSSNGFGHQALQSNTGSNSNGFGYFALRLNKGVGNNAFGHQVLHDDPGATVRTGITAIGYNIPWSAITKNNQTVFTGHEIIGLDLTNARINSAAGNALVTKDWVASQNYLTKNKYLDVVQVTANRNLLATDAGKNLIIEANATITVQNSTSQAFAVGDVVDIRVALGSTLTIAASAGVTIYYDAGTLSGSGSFDVAGFKRVRVVCEAEDVFSIG